MSTGSLSDHSVFAKSGTRYFNEGLAGGGPNKGLNEPWSWLEKSTAQLSHRAIAFKLVYKCVSWTIQDR